MLFSFFFPFFFVSFFSRKKERGERKEKKSCVGEVNDGAKQLHVCLFAPYAREAPGSGLRKPIEDSRFAVGGVKDQRSAE